MKYYLFAFLTAIIFCMVPIVAFASFEDLSVAVSDLSKDFSEKFCASIQNGTTTEKAGENAANQLSKDLLFSPVLKELISSSKEDLAASLSNNIFDGCGNDLGGTKEELDDYLAQLADKVPSKSSYGLQFPPTRQKSSE